MLVFIIYICHVTLYRYTFLRGLCIQYTNSRECCIKDLKLMKNDKAAELYKSLSLLLDSCIIYKNVLQQNLKRICLAKLYFIPMAASTLYKQKKKKLPFRYDIHEPWQELNIKYWYKNCIKTIYKFLSSILIFLTKYICCTCAHHEKNSHDCICFSF